ncbi:hypothetical protein [Hoeflea sp.]|uniref:hypothetical protein n=1 Tax=Hoeflea sp. TaxID=1940281 RepID=UPI003A8FBCBB
MRPFIGALTILGRVKPWLRKLAMEVCVFHESNSAWELKRRPLADHHVHLVSLVLVAFDGQPIHWIDC